MIVLRIDAHGHSADVRWAGAEAVLGSGPPAVIQREDAGWAPREAVLVHLGDEVLIVRADGRGQWRLCVGDSLRLGDATVTLLGLVPLPDAEPEPRPLAPPVPQSKAEPRFALEPLGEASPSSAPAASAVFSDPTIPDWLRANAASERPVVALSGSLALDAANTTTNRTPSGRAAADAVAPAPAPAPRFAPTMRLRFGDNASFDDQLWAVLKRSPWWLLSGAIHALLLLAMSLLSPATPLERRAEPSYGMVAASVPPEEAYESGGPLETADLDRPPDEAAAPDLSDLAESVTEMETEPGESAEPSPAEPPTPPDDEAQAPVVLIGPSAASLHRRVGDKTVPAKKPASLGELSKVSEDPEQALEVNRKAAARVRDAIARGGGAVGKALRGLKTSDILVVRGSFDHMETVLEELSIPFTLKAPHEVAREDDLSGHKMIFWNCGESVLAPRLHNKVVAAVREFVRDGGYLFTTDWCVSNLLMPAFPGYLATDGRTKPLPELIVSVRAADGAADHALLDGVFAGEATQRWWLEQASFDLKVLKKDAVQVLAEAPELAAPPLERSPAIAVTFSFGRGRVLHVMGHYYQQKGNLAGAIGVQRLPLNFVRMRFEGDASSPLR